MSVILADNQDITRAGLQLVMQQMAEDVILTATDKNALLMSLKERPESVVVIDYTLFDFNDVDEMLIFVDRFGASQWILFSEDLSLDFIRMVIAASPRVSVLLKESSLSEIRECIKKAIRSQRFICQRITEMILTAPQVEEKNILTRTETEVLKDIALGMTTKEIAEKRFSSFHTVNTHRKNIFRKLGVNNIHEATRYALRAGLVDSAEYYI